MPSGRPARFPELINFKAERGLLKAVETAARQERTTTAEYLRRRLRAALQADGIPLPPLETPRASSAPTPQPGE